jgi:lysozyme family protein
MTTPRFNNFIPFIFKWEGEYYENVSGDPGGPTHFGIDSASHPNVNIRALTKQGATDIYFDEWTKNQCGSLPLGLGEVYFNACVNCGVGRANALINHTPEHTAEQFLTAQEDFYQRLVKIHPKLGKFLNGWLNRTTDLRKWITLKP